MHRRSVVVCTGMALAGCLSEPNIDENPGEGREFRQEYVERVFVERFNKMRMERSLPTVNVNDQLSQMGQSHAENMAKNEYIGHEQPDGTSTEERFRERGLACELSIPGSNRYYPAAENVAGAAEGEVTHPGTEETFDVDTNGDLAAFLMDSWMSSDGHRKVMVLPTVREIGLGIAKKEEDIYAALEFC